MIPKAKRRRKNELSGSIVRRSHPYTTKPKEEFEGSYLVEEFMIEDTIFKARLFSNSIKPLNAGEQHLLHVKANTGDKWRDSFDYRELYVTAYVNEDRKTPGSHILCIFSIDGTRIIETSDKFGDIEIFKKAAVEIASKYMLEKGSAC